MNNLHAHANVWDTCLQLLLRRNYGLRIEIGVDDDDPYVYRAEREGFSFTAWNPIELLGLTAIHEDVQPSAARPYWWSANDARTLPGDRIEDQLKRTAYAKRDAREAALVTMRAERPAEFRAEIEQWWHEYEGGVREIAGRLGVRTSVLSPWLLELGLQST
jgi:hypothetical protein